MTPELPAALVREALGLLGGVAGPVLLALLLVGLLVGVLQAATQVNDPALSFLPRAAAGATVVWLAGGWILERLSGFLAESLTRMAGH